MGYFGSWYIPATMKLKELPERPANQKTKVASEERVYSPGRYADPCIVHRQCGMKAAGNRDREGRHNDFDLHATEGR